MSHPSPPPQPSPRPPVVLTARDVAEAELARELRALGVPRLCAITLAERHTGRMSFDPVGDVRATLADGTTLQGALGFQALATELHAALIKGSLTQ